MTNADERHGRDEQHEEAHSGHLDSDGPVERAGAALLLAFHAAFHTDVTELTDTVLRVIGLNYGSMCFIYGPDPHPVSVRQLRAAMNAYSAATGGAADRFLFPEEHPFGEHVPGTGAVSLSSTGQRIRAAYAKQREGKHDGAAFDALVNPKGEYWPDRWQLNDVAEALVKVSAKAAFINRKYFGGRLGR